MEIPGAPGLVPIRSGGRTRRLGPLWTHSGAAREALTRCGRQTRGLFVGLKDADRSAPRDSSSDACFDAQAANSHRIHAGSTAAYGPHFRQKSTFGEFWRGIIRQQCTHRAVSRANLHPYMMHVAWGTLQKPWDSTRTDAGVKHMYVFKPRAGKG